MLKKISKRHLLLITAVILVFAAIGTAALMMHFNKNNTPTPVTSEKPSASIPEKADKPPVKPAQSYQGASTVVANTFSIKVPSGWRASVSESPSFLAIMFARPNQLESLVYDATNTPILDHDGIPLWNGLTEHFFIIMPTASRAFNPDDHLEVSSKPFKFDDGTAGQYYYVVKHAEEAQKWGGLQKDTEWQGRTYIYEKDGKRVEAHLALYPSTGISVPFYESVIRTLQL